MRHVLLQVCALVLISELRIWNPWRWNKVGERFLKFSQSFKKGKEIARTDAKKYVCLSKRNGVSYKSRDFPKKQVLNFFIYSCLLIAEFSVQISLIESTLLITNSCTFLVHFVVSPRDSTFHLKNWPSLMMKTRYVFLKTGASLILHFV